MRKGSRAHTWSCDHTFIHTQPLAISRQTFGFCFFLVGGGGGIGKEAAPEFNRHVRYVTPGLPASHYANNVLTRDRQRQRGRQREYVWCRYVLQDWVLRQTRLLVNYTHNSHHSWWIGLNARPDGATWKWPNSTSVNISLL